MSNPGWKHSPVGVWLHEPSLRGQYESPGLPHWCTLLARCLRKVATQMGLELYFNSAAQFPGHISGSEPVGKRRYQVQCISILQMEISHLAAYLLFSYCSFWTQGRFQQFPEHNGAFPHLSWDQPLLLSYLLRICLFEQEPNDEVDCLRRLSVHYTCLLHHIFFKANLTSVGWKYSSGKSENWTL